MQSTKADTPKLLLAIARALEELNGAIVVLVHAFTGGVRRSEERAAPQRLTCARLLEVARGRGEIFCDAGAALSDYTAEPDPSLAAEDARWADALLREKGFRG